MAKRMTWVKVAVLKLPPCDLCKLEGVRPRIARYDGKTRSGQWAYMCEDHFRWYGIGLGEGRGQKLVVERMVEKRNRS